MSFQPILRMSTEPMQHASMSSSSSNTLPDTTETPSRIHVVEVTHHTMTPVQEEELLGPIVPAPSTSFSVFYNEARLQQFDATYEGYYIHMDEKLIEHFGQIGNHMTIRDYLEHLFGTETDIELASDRKELVTETFRDKCRRHAENREYYRAYMMDEYLKELDRPPPGFSATDRRPARAYTPIIPFSRGHSRLKTRRSPPIADEAMEEIRKGVENAQMKD